MLDPGDQPALVQLFQEKNFHHQKFNSDPETTPSEIEIIYRGPQIIIFLWKQIPFLCYYTLTLVSFQDRVNYKINYTCPLLS